jgi:hypothetical protein
VRDEHARVIEVEKQMLAAPPDRFDGRSFERTRELTRRVLRRKPRSQQLGLDNLSATQNFVERACDQFDFRKLRHL